jgi:hypothetical protein
MPLIETSIVSSPSSRLSVTLCHASTLTGQGNVVPDFTSRAGCDAITGRSTATFRATCRHQTREATRDRCSAEEPRSFVRRGPSTLDAGDRTLRGRIRQATTRQGSRGSRYTRRGPSTNAAAALPRWRIFTVVGSLLFLAIGGQQSAGKRSAGKRSAPNAYKVRTSVLPVIEHGKNRNTEATSPVRDGRRVLNGRVEQFVELNVHDEWLLRK